VEVGSEKSERQRVVTEPKRGTGNAQHTVQNDDRSRTLSPSKRIFVYRPPNANTGDGYTKQANDERPMEDVGEWRHQNLREEFLGFRLKGQSGSRVCLVLPNR